MRGGERERYARSFWSHIFVAPPALLHTHGPCRRGPRAAARHERALEERRARAESAFSRARREGEAALGDGSTILTMLRHTRRKRREGGGHRGRWEMVPLLMSLASAASSSSVGGAAAAMMAGRKDGSGGSGAGALEGERRVRFIECDGECVWFERRSAERSRRKRIK